MKARALVLISGISDKAYSLSEIMKHDDVAKTLTYKYGIDNIIEIDYQPIMDQAAILGDTLLDPLRLLMNPNGWRAENYVRETLNNICTQYETVDVMTHSLGSWIILKCNAKINKLILIASPIGFAGIIGRESVRLNIWKPKLEAFRMYTLYSKNDPVSCFPPVNRETSKWRCGSDLYHEYDTKTGHGLDQYLSWIWANNREILLS